MIAAVGFSILGYLAVCVAHPRQLLGFNFRTREWSEGKKILHAALGHTCVYLTVVQALAGHLRLSGHRQLGKIVHVIGIGNAVLATWFWTWDVGVKVVLSALLLCSLFCSFCGCQREKRQYNVRYEQPQDDAEVATM